jgi:hypothetical protein
LLEFIINHSLFKKREKAPNSVKNRRLIEFPSFAEEEKSQTLVLLASVGEDTNSFCVLVGKFLLAQTLFFGLFVRLCVLKLLGFPYVVMGFEDFFLIF